MIDTCVKLKNMNDAIKFVNEVNKYPYDADLERGSFMIDAKSLLGVIGMGIGQDMNLKIYADKADEMLNGISGFIKPAGMKTFEK